MNKDSLVGVGVGELRKSSFSGQAEQRAENQVGQKG